MRRFWVVPALLVVMSGCASAPGQTRADISPVAVATTSRPVRTIVAETPAATPTPTPVPSSTTPAANPTNAQALAQLVEDNQWAETYTVEHSDGFYSDAQIVAVDDYTIGFEYTCALPVTREWVLSYIDSLGPNGLADMAATEVIPDMRSYGMTGDLAVQFTFLTADGDVLWTDTVP